MQQIAANYKLEAMLRFIKTAPPGPIVEVGVYQGGSLARLASTGRQCFGYDTFKGMPPLESSVDYCRRGDFNDTSLERVGHDLSKYENIKLIPGLYPESDTVNPTEVILAHVDVDLHSSTLNSLRHLWPQMARGGRIYLDDAFVETCHGATLALCEFCSETKAIPHGTDNVYWLQK